MIWNLLSLKNFYIQDYNNLYENRNAIAHGRNRVEITLSDYCMAEVFVMTLIDDIANKCLKRYALKV